MLDQKSAPKARFFALRHSNDQDEEPAASAFVRAVPALVAVQPVVAQVIVVSCATAPPLVWPPKTWLPLVEAEPTAATAALWSNLTWVLTEHLGVNPVRTKLAPVVSEGIAPTALPAVPVQTSMTAAIETDEATHRDNVTISFFT